MHSMARILKTTRSKTQNTCPIEIPHLLQSYRLLHEAVQHDLKIAVARTS